jgi:hypothetical protein
MTTKKDEPADLSFYPAGSTNENPIDKQEPQVAAPVQTPVTVVIQQDDRAAQAAAAMAEGQALQMDTTVPGGKYKVDGQWLDANGQPVKN